MNLMEFVRGTELQVLVLPQQSVVGPFSDTQNLSGDLCCSVIVVEEAVVQHHLVEGVLLDQVLRAADSHLRRLLDLIVTTLQLV